MSYRVLMLLANGFRPDPRVLREAQALARDGYEVTIAAWDRTAERPAEETLEERLQVRRIHSAPSRYGKGPLQLFRIRKFWAAAERLADEVQPHVVHSHDLDTLYPGVRRRRKLGCKLVYDAHEHYPAMMTLYLPPPLPWVLSMWERILLRSVDGILTASDTLAGEWLPSRKVLHARVGNYADVDAYGSSDSAALREAWGVGEDETLVVYVGGFSRNRALLPLLEAAEELPGFAFHLWGDGHQRQAVEHQAKASPRVTFHGWCPPHEIPGVMQAADIVYYGLKPDYPGARFNAPNALAHAMAAGRPVVATDVGDLGSIVRENECGLLVAKPEAASIRDALEQLRPAGIRARLGQNGWRAAQTTYNLGRANDNLLQLYRELLRS